MTSGAGGGLRPIASPDGRLLVYPTRAGTRTALRIRDLRTQEDRWLVGETQRDDQEGYAPNDIFPGYAFTPDSRAVVFLGGGRIRKVDIATGDVTTIPFSADVELGMGERLFVPHRIPDGPVPVTQLIAPVESPDHRLLAFSAVGKVFVANLSAGGAATPGLTRGSDREYFPAFSPDGQWIAWVSWNDSTGGYVWKARADGTGTPLCLTSQPAAVSTPMWSPAGGRIVFSASPRQAGLAFGPVVPMPRLLWVPANGGDAVEIAANGSSPALVTGSGPLARVYFTEIEPGTGATFPITDAGEAGLSINLASPSVPLRRITNEGANYAAWMDGGRTIGWSFANHYHRVSTDTVMKYPVASSWNIESFDVTLTVPRTSPDGRVLLRGARIITMRGDEVIERGDVLVRNNRIEQVGASLNAPAGTPVIDVSGKTIIPGLVDVHAHPQTGRELAQGQEWSIASNLAFGVTTTRNPSGSRWNFAWGELIDAGEMVGSRIFATGFPLTSTNAPVRNAEDALHVVRRYKEQGANSLKQYLQPRRIQRQWILQAALAEGINATNEGAADLKADITMAIVGYTAIEHSIGIGLYTRTSSLY